eukprot:3716695-Alexandrium_andersonii.AAC.1
MCCARTCSHHESLRLVGAQSVTAAGPTPARDLRADSCASGGRSGMRGAREHWHGPASREA